MIRMARKRNSSKTNGTPSPVDLCRRWIQAKQWQVARSIIDELSISTEDYGIDPVIVGDLERKIRLGQQAQPLYVEAERAMQDGRFKQARAAYLKILEFAPDEYEARLALRVVESQQTRAADVAALLNTVRDAVHNLNPAAAEDGLAQLREFDIANEEIDSLENEVSVLHRLLDRRDRYLEQAGNELQQKEYDRARETLERAIEIDPSCLEARMLFANLEREILRETNQKTLMNRLDEIDRALLANDYIQVLELAYSMRRIRGVREISRLMIEKAVAGLITDKRLNILCQEAERAFREDDFDKAILLWETALSIEEDNPDVRGCLDRARILTRRTPGERIHSTEINEDQTPTPPEPIDPPATIN